MRVKLNVFLGVCFALLLSILCIGSAQALSFNTTIFNASTNICSQTPALTSPRVQTFNITGNTVYLERVYVMINSSTPTSQVNVTIGRPLANGTPDWSTRFLVASNTTITNGSYTTFDYNVTVHTANMSAGNYVAFVTSSGAAGTAICGVTPSTYANGSEGFNAYATIGTNSAWTMETTVDLGMIFQLSDNQQSNFTVTANDIYNGTGINTFNATINGTLYATTTGSIVTNISSNSSINVTVVAQNYFNNVTINQNASSQLSASLFPYTAIRAQSYLGGTPGSIGNFTVNYTNNANSTETGSIITTVGIAYIPLFNATYNVTLYNAQNGSINYSQGNTNLTANPYNQSYNFTLYVTNTINFLFEDETNNSIMNGINVTAYLTSNTYSTNFTTSNGTYNISLLQPVTYTITYSAPGYYQRTYVFTLVNQTANSITLFLLSNANGQPLEITIKDQNLLPIINSTVYINKKNISGTNYYTVSSCFTDVNGRCIAIVNTYNTTYNVIFSYNSFLGQSNDLQFTSNDIANGRTFYLALTTSTLSSIYTWNTLGDTARLTIQPNTINPNGTVTYLLTNTNLLASQACLLIYSQTGSTRILSSTSCSSGAAISISSTINVSQGQDMIVAEGHITFNGLDILILTRSADINSNPLGTNDNQKLAVFIVVFGVGITMVLMFTWNPILPPIVLAMVWFVFARIGLLSGTQNVIIGMVFGAGLIVIMIARRT